MKRRRPKKQLNEIQATGALLVLLAGVVALLYGLAQQSSSVVAVGAGLMITGLFILTGKEPPRDGIL